MPILGPRLREVFAAFLHMAQRLFRTSVRRTRLKPPRALMGVTACGSFERRADALQFGLMRRRKEIQIEEFHIIAASVVIAADEPCVRGDVDTHPLQTEIYFGAVGHGGEEASVGSAAASAAG